MNTFQKLHKSISYFTGAFYTSKTVFVVNINSITAVSISKVLNCFNLIRFKFKTKLN